MIDIIPNWHPVFVHFTIALLSLTVCFHLLGRFVPAGDLKKQFETLADWNLWLGTGFGIITAFAGWMAYNSVTHDAPSHAAMTDHRNWAWATLTLFIILSGYSLWRATSQSRPGAGFLGILLLAGLMLGGTAWRGAEVVFRHGIGVMSLPQSEAGGHDHAAHEHTASARDDHPMHATPEPPDTGNQDHAAHDHSESVADDHQMDAKPGAEENGDQSPDTSEYAASGDDKHSEEDGQRPEGATENHDHADHDH